MNNTTTNNWLIIKEKRRQYQEGMKLLKDIENNKLHCSNEKYISLLMNKDILKAEIDVLSEERKVFLRTI